MIFDPEGKTTALLRRAGFAPKPWTGTAVPDGTVLAIGRRAMSDAGFNVKAFRTAVQNGARAVLFSQDPQLLRERGGIRVHQWINRQFWPVETQKSHPLIVGLDENDLRDWTGSGSLLPPRNADDLAESALRRGYPVYGYRVGARRQREQRRLGETAPQRLDAAAGRRVRHGLLASHGTALRQGLPPELQPRSRRSRRADGGIRSARRVIQTTATAKVEPRRPVFYTGDEATCRWLKSSGLIFTKLAAAPPAGSIVIAGPGSALKPSASR